MPVTMPEPLSSLHAEIVTCHQCPRLVAWRQEVASTKRRAYQEWDYWGRPVPGFGDPDARLLLVGLAPGAHGANRTGRAFTGDGSGNFLYAALFRTGFANQPTSEHREDGLHLLDCFITMPLRCVPPQNRPVADELNACRPYMAREIALLPRVQVLLCLGGVAFEQTLRTLRGMGMEIPRMKFSHGAQYEIEGSAGDADPLAGRWKRLSVLCCYHPSLQNTNTGRLTPDMLDRVLNEARLLLA
jgi:uracil-DNA glycosylase family 4